MTSAADVRSFDVEGQTLTNVRIEETGSYRVPASVFASPIRSSVLEVIDISVDRTTGTLLLVPSGGIVTTEMMTDDVRLQIVPKFGFDGLDILLSWSTVPVKYMRDTPLPIDVSENIGVYEVFAQRLLSAMLPIFQRGLAAQPRRSRIVGEDVRGAISLVDTWERIEGRAELVIVQDVWSASVDAPWNRVLRAALLCIAGSGQRVSSEVRKAAVLALQRIPVSKHSTAVRHALQECREILSGQTLDPMRSYYYQALIEAEKVLNGVHRTEEGDPAVYDVPIRLSMPTIFEDAVRNVVASALGPAWHVRKDKGLRLYDHESPGGFGPAIEPDITIWHLGERARCFGVLDVKYKHEITPGDHYQLNAYADVYSPAFAGIVGVADYGDKVGVVGLGETRGSTEVQEYRVDASDLREGFRRLGLWIREEIAKTGTQALSGRLGS